MDYSERFDLKYIRHLGFHKPMYESPVQRQEKLGDFICVGVQDIL